MAYRMKPPGTPAQKVPRERLPAYLHRIRLLPCLICDKTPSEAAHIRMASSEWGKDDSGLGMKPSDRWVVPLCADCHRLGDNAQHTGNERKWWEKHGIDPLDVATALYAAHSSGGTHFDLARIIIAKRGIR